MACAIRSEHHTLKQVRADSQPSQAGMKTALSPTLGQLATVSDSTVPLAHQSVKEFILQQAALNESISGYPDNHTGRLYIGHCYSVYQLARAR
jgi:hypothetical protein